jgi:hypothetical protein
MPTPPFSQHRRDWLSEVCTIFSKKPQNEQQKPKSPHVPNTTIAITLPKACDSVIDFKDGAPAKD